MKLLTHQVGNLRVGSVALQTQALRGTVLIIMVAVNALLRRMISMSEGHRKISSAMIKRRLATGLVPVIG